MDSLHCFRSFNFVVLLLSTHNRSLSLEQNQSSIQYTIIRYIDDLPATRQLCSLDYWLPCRYQAVEVSTSEGLRSQQNTIWSADESVKCCSQAGAPWTIAQSTMTYCTYSYCWVFTIYSIIYVSLFYLPRLFIVYKHTLFYISYRLRLLGLRFRPGWLYNRLVYLIYGCTVAVDVDVDRMCNKIIRIMVPKNELNDSNLNKLSNRC